MHQPRRPAMAFQRRGEAPGVRGVCAPAKFAVCLLRLTETRSQSPRDAAPASACQRSIAPPSRSTAARLPSELNAARSDPRRLGARKRHRRIVVPGMRQDHVRRNGAHKQQSGWCWVAARPTGWRLPRGDGAPSLSSLRSHERALPSCCLPANHNKLCRQGGKLRNCNGCRPLCRAADCRGSPALLCVRCPGEAGELAAGAPR